MQIAAHLHASPHAEPSRLWARAAQLIASLISFIGPPAGLLRMRDTTPRDRREIGFMLAPIEALVRSLLLADAIAWLTGTDEGAEMLQEAAREARRSGPPQQPARRAAASARTVPQDDPFTDEKAAAPEPAAAPEDARENAPGDALSDADIARLLAPSHLRFALHEPTQWGREPPPPRRAAAARSSRRARRRPPANLALARRYEALRRIIADPHAAMLVLARDLARRELGMLYVPTPRNWIDERWGCGRSDIYRARRVSFTRFCFFEAHRKRIRTLALPPPEPG